jgi:sarcosine oxidase
MDNVDYDVAVIGAGINGLCTAYALSKTPGLRILLLEQFDLEHCEGSSHSQIRITRAAYTDPLYAMMANQVRNVDWPQL